MTASSPMRMCIGCRRSLSIDDLVRISRDRASDTTAVITVDVPGAPGRGAWLCRSVACVEAAVARSAFSRAFRTKLADAICGDTLIDWLRLHPELRP